MPILGVKLYGDGNHDEGHVYPLVCAVLLGYVQFLLLSHAHPHNALHEFNSEPSNVGFKILLKPPEFRHAVIPLGHRHDG